MYADIIKRPRKNRALDQSDVFKQVTFGAIGDQASQKILAILITPACDIFQTEKGDVDKLQFLNFCAVLPFDVLLAASWIKKYNITEDQFIEKGLVDRNGDHRKSEIKEIFKMINGQRPRYHWVGEIPGLIGYWYVDYQLTQSLHISELEKLRRKRIVYIKSPLRESIPAGFVNYNGRIGLPGEKPEKETYAEKVYEDMKTLFANL